MAQKERNGPNKKLSSTLIKTFGYICSSVPVKLLLTNVTLRKGSSNKFSLTHY